MTEKTKKRNASVLFSLDIVALRIGYIRIPIAIAERKCSALLR